MAFRFTSPSASIPDRADLLVVGGGIAGLYTSLRYLEAHPDAHVVILERLNRPGGRLQTDLVDFEVDGETVVVRDEEGGMRFNYDMEELMQLFRHLDLCDRIVPFPMAPVRGPNHNRYLLRGRPFTVRRAAAHPEIWAKLYRLDEEERGKAPVQILTEAYGAVYAQNRDALVEPLRQTLAREGKPFDPETDLPSDGPPQHPTPEYWQVFRIHGTLEGTPLYKWQMWGLLRALGHSEECCTMLARTLGFEGPFWSTMNAGEAFQLMEDFPADPTYFTFEEGFSTLINAVVARLAEFRNASLFLSTNVDALREDGDGGFVAEVTQAPEGVSSSPFVPGGVKSEVRAERVVLALPRKALETMFATSPALNHRRSEDGALQERAQQLWDDLQTTTNQRLLKINLYFDHAWWQSLDPPVQYGPSFTDLPLNAVYPFYSLRGVEGDREATRPPDPSLPAALTIYCDWNNTNFWEGLQEVGEPYEPTRALDDAGLTAAVRAGTGDDDPVTIFPASSAVVKQAVAMFGELFQTDVPAPVMTSFRLWDGEHDFGYAVHQWGLDARDDEVIPRLAQPFDDVAIYTCNEAYSDMQGWVNGSLRSANLVLAKLGVDPLGAEICSDDWWTDGASAEAPRAAGLWGLAAPSGEVS